MADNKGEQAIREWNKKKSFRNFAQLYREGFTYYTLWQNPVWRVFRIIRNTLTGRYLWCEGEFDKRADNGQTQA